MLIGGSNFDPDVPFRPLNVKIFRNEQQLTYRNVGGKLHAFVQVRLTADHDYREVWHARQTY